MANELRHDGSPSVRCASEMPPEFISQVSREYQNQFLFCFKKSFPKEITEDKIFPIEVAVATPLAEILQVQEEKGTGSKNQGPQCRGLGRGIPRMKIPVGHWTYKATRQDGTVGQKTPEVMIRKEKREVAEIRNYLMFDHINNSFKSFTSPKLIQRF